MLAIAPRCSSRTAASLLILALLLLLALPLQAASRPVHVLATTYPVWQLARPLVAGLENVRLDLLIPAATGCPHDYAPTPADLTKVATADVILMNGLGLEAAFAPALAQAEARKADKSELIMRVVEGREVTEIYGTVDEKKNTLGNILIITEDAANLSVVRLRGKFNLSDVINSNSKKVHFFTNEPNHSSLIESTSPN